ncbi:MULTISPECIES: SpaA isopeptide-forming pilin-related protein [unclassified Lactococcus]|uniref:SpaA isopeptide-forming pilin-related protein n=1 Tax=unclassified Lactococcus TaxID=2643510 RepID=UPI0011CC429F|nr:MULTISPECIES: SpaA isopeptide-forming pilin-related protein [unclassified Lactococcus]MQW23177.1 VWA domain-containing protein [Lactococcus sp. dk101]TXK44228.1 VWA domain-containing protein [Lactococcus sp. dk310]TXK49959.1 VWA domain-containing protein [Lactococcus sp. dk322]
MKQKCLNYLSLLVILLNFIPGVLFGTKVVSDTLKSTSDNIELISASNLKVSYNVTETTERNLWEVKYQIIDTDLMSKQKLKFSFNSDANLTITSSNNWSNTSQSTYNSEFTQSEEGTFQVSSTKDIENIFLSIQMDTQKIIGKNTIVDEDVLSADVGKTYKLSIPEQTEESRSQSETSFSSESKSSTSTREGATNSSTKSEKSQSSSTNSSVKITQSVVYPSNFALSTTLSATLFENFSPKYTQDSTGTYPTNSWTSTGNTTVVNHQGNKNASSTWDGLTSWSGDPTNQTNSYIEYGGIGSNADFAIRKYAKETSTPGLYDVYLNIRGNTQKNIKPLDIVLVVDMSGSMEPDRASATRAGVKQFLQAIQDAGLGAYVNVGLVGFSSPGEYATGANGYITVPMSNVSNSQATSINNKLNVTFSGGTFTQLGIRQGTQMLQSDTSGHDKMMILLTDGVPTFSYHINSAVNENSVVFGTTFNTTIEAQGFTSKFVTPYNVSGQSIPDTWAATLGEARLSKNSGIQLHTLGIQLGPDTSNNVTYLSTGQVRAKASLIASPAKYEDAQTSSDIQTYLMNQAKDVVSSFNTVINGSISDPIGSQFIYNGTPDIKSVGTTAVTSLPSVTVSNGTLSSSGINLGSGQEIQIHYQVRLNTETSDFVPGQWYQMNGRTTFAPNIANPDNKVDFGVPSAKGEGVSLTFNKTWEEYDGDTSLRPSSITYQVTRKNTTQTNAWQLGYIDVTGTNQQNSWTVTTQQLATIKGGQKILWLPKYNTNGVAFTYSISNEISVPGYDSTQVDATTYKNVKQFIPLQLTVTKKDNLGNNLPGAKFKLTLNGTEITGTTDSNGYTFKYSGLKPGTYTLEETQAPDGYTILTKTFTIVIQSNGKVLVDNKEVTVDNHNIQINVTNQMKGVLPQTGGSGPIIYWIVGSLLFIMFIITGLFYLNGKRKNVK